MHHIIAVANLGETSLGLNNGEITFFAKVIEVIPYIDPRLTLLVSEWVTCPCNVDSSVTEPSSNAYQTLERR